MQYTEDEANTRQLVAGYPAWRCDVFDARSVHQYVLADVGLSDDESAATRLVGATRPDGTASSSS